MKGPVVDRRGETVARGAEGEARSGRQPVVGITRPAHEVGPCLHRVDEDVSLHHDVVAASEDADRVVVGLVEGDVPRRAGRLDFDGAVFHAAVADVAVDDDAVVDIEPIGAVGDADLASPQVENSPVSHDADVDLLVSLELSSDPVEGFADVESARVDHACLQFDQLVVAAAREGRIVHLLQRGAERRGGAGE